MSFFYETFYFIWHLIALIANIEFEFSDFRLGALSIIWHLTFLIWRFCTLQKSCLPEKFRSAKLSYKKGWKKLNSNRHLHFQPHFERCSKQIFGKYLEFMNICASEKVAFSFISQTPNIYVRQISECVHQLADQSSKANESIATVRDFILYVNARV